MSGSKEKTIFYFIVFNYLERYLVKTQNVYLQAFPANSSPI